MYFIINEKYRQVCLGFIFPSQVTGNHSLLDMHQAATESSKKPPNQLDQPEYKYEWRLKLELEIRIRIHKLS